MKFKLVILFILITILSCNLGLNDGSDLIGKWTHDEFSLNLYEVDGVTQVRYSFNEDGIGQLKETFLWILPIIYSFTWSTEIKKPYNMLIIDYPDETNKDDITYNYYFSLNKESLYLKKENTTKWWKKWNKE
ncbi:MAG: hypothetical protein KAT05_05515 [Spirochaetes bacterium]|nr:hypothetical protein [Spirochaetota bacterium]